MTTLRRTNFVLRLKISAKKSGLPKTGNQTTFINMDLDF
jgi:hypothetical protein